jgi:hypothetical protein
MRFEISTSCSRVSNGTLAHLLEIHANWIIQYIELGVGLFLFLFLLLFFVLLVVFANFFDAIDIRGLDNLDFHASQLADDRIQVIWIADSLGEMFIKILVSEVALLLGQPDEIPDLLLDHFRNAQGHRLRGAIEFGAQG